MKRNNSKRNKSKKNNSKKNNKTGSGVLFDIFKVSAVSSAGFMLGIIPQMIIGALLLFLGIYLITENNNKNYTENNNENNNENNHGLEFYLGIILIIFGSILSLNLFLGVDIVTDALSQ